MPAHARAEALQQAAGGAVAAAAAQGSSAEAAFTLFVAAVRVKHLVCREVHGSAPQRHNLTFYGQLVCLCQRETTTEKISLAATKHVLTEWICASPSSASPTGAAGSSARRRAVLRARLRICWRPLREVRLGHARELSGTRKDMSSPHDNLCRYGESRTWAVPNGLVREKEGWHCGSFGGHFWNTPGASVLIVRRFLRRQGVKDGDGSV